MPLRRSLPCALLALATAACSREAPLVSARTWPEADAIFHTDTRWIGADGAYSVNLGNGRILWLFGDTFVADTPARTRAQASMPRNTLALQTGADPSRALMAFVWGVDPNGGPASWLPEDGDTWFWPGGGARLGGTLLLFYARIHSPAGDPTGFEAIGWRALVIDDPDDEPSAWRPRDASLPPGGSFDAELGTAVMIDGGYLYAYGARGQDHDILLARWTVEAASTGDLTAPEWWCGDAGWQSGSSVDPEVVVADGPPEMSVHADGRLAPYVLVQSEGYGATTLALRVADAPEGPWTPPRSFMMPPESLAPDAFVYAGKAHPELAGADLVATYVPSSFTDSDVDDLYYPHFVRITYP